MTAARFDDDGHKRDALLTETFGRFVEWVPVCPEVECGFGTPREAMRPVRIEERLRPEVARHYPFRKTPRSEFEFLPPANSLGLSLFAPANRPFVRPNPAFAAFWWSALKWATIIARVFRDARVVEIF